MTTLRDQTAALLKAEMDFLGDEITYTPTGGAAVTFNAWVEFNTDHVTSPGSSATAYPKSVEVLMSQIADPNKADRVSIALRPGIIYAPADIIEGATGETWILPLKKVTS